MEQVIQECKCIEDKTSGDVSLIFKYIIDGKTSLPVKYKVIYPLGGIISGSFLSAVKASIGEAIELNSDDISGRRLAEALSGENLNKVVKGLYEYLEKHYLINALLKKQFSKTICHESIIIAVPYSANIVFVYRGRSDDNSVAGNLALNDKLDFYGVFCGDAFYLQSQSEAKKFIEADYCGEVCYSTIDQLHIKMIDDIRVNLKSRIRGAAINLPDLRLHEEMIKLIQSQFMDMAHSDYINGRTADTDKYLLTFPSDKTEKRLRCTTNICGYLSDPASFAEKEAERHIDESGEDMLFYIEQSRLVACELVRLTQTGELDEVKKLLKAIKGVKEHIDFIILKDNQKFQFRLRPDTIVDVNHISADLLTPKDKHAFYNKFGLSAEIQLSEITRIAHGRKTIYKRGISIAERLLSIVN